MSQPSQIRLSEVKEWLRKETAPQIEPLKGKATSLLKEVKERVDDTVQSSQRIFENSENEMNKDNPKTHRFARNAHKFAQNLTETMKAINVPDNFDYERLLAFCGDLEKTATSLDKLRWGAYPYISPYFIIDRRRLDVSLKRLYDITKELRNFLTTKYASEKTVEDAYSLVDKLTQTIDEAKLNREGISQTEERETAFQNEIVAIKQKITDVQAKAELNELVKLNQKIEEIGESVKHSLRYLQKPFYKLQSLARSSDVAVPPDELHKLDDYLKNPSIALATEEDDYSTLKSILGKLDTTITQGKLKLKSTRLRKAQDQIDSILNKDSLGQLQKSCRELLSQRRQLLASETVATFQNQLTQLQNQLRELQKENEFVSSKRKALKDTQIKLQERTEHLRKELEKKIAQLTNKKVQVGLSA